MSIRISLRSLAAVSLSAAVLLGTAACSSAGSESADGKAVASASSGTTGQGAPAQGGGPCRDTMKHITEAGQKLTADAADKAKATAHLQDIAKQFAADAEKIKNPEAKQAAKQLSEVYGKLADSAKNNQSPDMKTLPGQVQGAISALSQCAATE